MTTTPPTRIGKTTVAALLVGSNLRRFTPQFRANPGEDVAAPRQRGRGWLGDGHAAAEGQLGRVAVARMSKAVGIVADNPNVVGAVIVDFKLRAHPTGSRRVFSVISSRNWLGGPGIQASAKLSTLTARRTIVLHNAIGNMRHFDDVISIISSFVCAAIAWRSRL